MQFLISEYFYPISRIFRLRTTNWALEHYDEYVDNVLRAPALKAPETRVEVEEILSWEVVFTVMQMCEDLVYSFESYRSSNPDPVAIFRKKLNATEFFERIGDSDDAYLVDVLSIAHSTIQRTPGPWPEDFAVALKNFRGFLVSLKKFYFDHLELYNHYKHGHRIAFISSIDGKQSPYSVLFSLPDHGDRNTVRADKADLADANYLAQGIVSSQDAIRKNWLHRKRDEPKGKWSGTIPIPPDKPAKKHV